MFKDLGISELGPELTGEHQMSTRNLKDLTSFQEAGEKRRALNQSMLSHVESEAKLIEEHSRANVNEQVLEEELKTEKMLRATTESTFHASVSQLKAYRLKNEAQARKLGQEKIRISMLEMRLKDLGEVRKQTDLNEQKVSERVKEVETRVRGLMRELQDIKVDNELMKATGDDKKDQFETLDEEMSGNMDFHLRARNRAEVQGIALEQQLSVEKVARDPLNQRLAAITEAEKTVINDLATFKIMDGQTRDGLKRCLNNNELANREITDQIVVKANNGSQLKDLVRDITSSLTELEKDIKDKDEICLSFQLDLHSQQEDTAAVGKRLRKKDLECNHLMTQVENAKSSHAVLAAKLEHEESTTRSIVAWAAAEKVTAGDLEVKLRKMRDGEGAKVLRKEELKAVTRQLQTKMDALVASLKTTREAVHKCRFKEECSATTLRRMDTEVKRYSERYVEKSALVDKAKKQLAQIETLSRQKMSALTLTVSSLDKEVQEREDEIHRLSSRTRVSEKQVHETQMMIEASAEKSGAVYVASFKDHTRLDALNVELQDEYRQVLTHNQIGEQALSTTNGRIDFAVQRMTKLNSSSAQLAKINQEEIFHMNNQFKKETASLDTLRDDMNAAESRQNQLVQEFDAAGHARRKIEHDLRQQKNESEEFSRKIEQHKEVKLDYEKMLDMMKAEEFRMTNILKHKTARCNREQKLLLNQQDKLSDVERDLATAESDVLGLYTQQKVDAAKIQELEHAFQISAEQHQMDQDSVKIKLAEIESELQEKDAVILKLNDFQTRMQTTEHTLRLRHTQAESEAARRASVFGNMLDKEQAAVARLRSANERMARENLSSRQKELAQDEVIKALEAKDAAYEADHEALTTNIFRLDRQAQSTAMATQRMIAKMNEQEKMGQDLQEDASEMMLKHQGDEFSERDLRRQIQELEEDNRHLKVKCAAKVREEHKLQLMIGKEKLNCDTNNHALASQHVEESFQKLLHDDSGEPGFLLKR